MSGYTDEGLESPDERDASNPDQPRVLTDGGEYVVSDHDTDEMAVSELREEFVELQDVVDFWKSYEGQETAWDRREAVWKALEARTDVEQPACPECGGRRWGQSPGDPVECLSCAWTARTEVEEAVHEAWQEIAEGDEGDAE